MRSNASMRRLVVSFSMIFLALILHGVAPASETKQAAGGKQISAQTTPGPRPTPTTPSPRPTPTTPSPRPTPTDPYPGGASLPQAPGGDSYFRVSDTAPAPALSRDLASIMWIALAILGVGLVIRWFFIAARPDDSG